MKVNKPIRHKVKLSYIKKGRGENNIREDSKNCINNLKVILRGYNERSKDDVIHFL